MSEQTEKKTGSARRRLVKAGAGLGVAVLLTVGVRTTVAEVFTVPLASMEPELPAGSRVLVYKLADSYSPGQIVAYRHMSGNVHLGRVDAWDEAAGMLVLNRNGVGTFTIAGKDVIGRVVLNTR